MKLALLLALLVVSPLAAARAPGPTDAAQAEEIAEALDAAVGRARTATVEHAFGDRNARETAHALRVESARIEDLRMQLGGLAPPRQLARAHDALGTGATWYASAFDLLEDCYRKDVEEACRQGSLQLQWAALYRQSARALHSGFA